VSRTQTAAPIGRHPSLAAAGRIATGRQKMALDAACNKPVRQARVRSRAGALRNRYAAARIYRTTHRSLALGRQPTVTDIVPRTRRVVRVASHKLSSMPAMRKRPTTSHQDGNQKGTIWNNKQNPLPPPTPRGRGNTNKDPHPSPSPAPRFFSKPPIAVANAACRKHRTASVSLHRSYGTALIRTSLLVDSGAPRSALSQQPLGRIGCSQPTWSDVLQRRPRPTPERRLNVSMPLPASRVRMCPPDGPMDGPVGKVSRTAERRAGRVPPAIESRRA